MQLITDHFLFAIGAALLVYELVVLGLGLKSKRILSALISPRILKASRDYPWLTAAIFYLLGHLTWPQKIGCE